ncbi:cell division protein FtsH, partial [Patescibacteria group bacterium]|nr:cell division protein FtsH [Patescibacteria group bacterium]
EQRNYSEKIAASIDHEIKKIIKRAYKRAWRLLADQRALLKKVALVLIKQETLEREEFEKLVKSYVKTQAE